MPIIEEYNNKKDIRYVKNSKIKDITPYLTNNYTNYKPIKLFNLKLNTG